MRVLVTGGLGFIGGGIAKALGEGGHSVRILDYGGPDSNTPPEFAEMELVQGDISDEGVCVEACAGIDVVVHSAAVHLALSVTRKPLQSIRTNVHGTLNVLRSAAAAGASRFVFLSSSKVYGEPERLPSVEDDYPRPMEPYGLSKAVCESYCQRFQAESQLRTVVVRPFSAYGPGQNLDTGYVGMLVSAILENEEPALPGQPAYLRDFVHVDDVVQVCVRAALAEGELPAVLNAGSGHTVSLKELVDLASRLSGKRLLPTFLKPQKGTITRTQASMKRTFAAVGLRETVKLEDGLRATFEYFLG